MRYRAFSIANFKGISEAKIELAQGLQSIPITLIGLNESGKTTLLEAIYSFNPDVSSKILFGQSSVLVPDEAARIPISRLSSFSDEIRISATIEISDADIDGLSQQCKAKGWKLDKESIPRLMTVSDVSLYINSTVTRKYKEWPTGFKFINNRGRPKESTKEQWDYVTDAMGGMLPSIAYFPTSVFAFPPKIYLSATPKSGLNNFYRRIFQDILDAQGEGMDVATHILGRVKSASESNVFSEIITAFFGSSERAKVQSVIDKVSATVSSVIVARWNSLFKHSNPNREVVVEYGVEPPIDTAASPEPVVFVEFKVKDGAERYNISSRSLGFRWFFCFLLFTQFRAMRKNSSGTLFLFDEPASNLHAAAQEELLESFLKVASLPNELIYSTHSHHLINPLWLEQAYIVMNESIDFEADVAGLQKSQAGDIKAVPYRQFVNSHPDRTSYFQPVLDRLEVRPSQLDLNQDCILLEGKSDYAILKYFATRAGSVPLIPAFGATTMGALIALLRGWGKRFVVMLDGDEKGIEARDRYRADYALADSEIALIGDLAPQVKEIENLLSKEDRVALQATAGTNKLTKKQIYSLFQQAAATGKVLPLSDGTIGRAEALLEALKARLHQSA